MARIITLGIGGAVQFAAGMRGADCIVAVNSDPEAPIFDVAHYGLVGDLYAILPLLLEQLEGGIAHVSYDPKDILNPGKVCQGGEGECTGAGHGTVSMSPGSNTCLYFLMWRCFTPWAHRLYTCAAENLTLTDTNPTTNECETKNKELFVFFN